ncbi:MULTISPECIES: L7Ae/L30e/S12e/Gadd45 family ribosomal protein [Pseudobutyrivibrio]|jgi:ribosomal protein L7Ae-like RNA K-turn-binding protein|nr:MULTISPECIES: ribosomal L7Ae/L30e/S12e/Gadd45 family protein [Pseudobutyrivibrio]SCX86843.1 Ribosomal protein L7Ae [Pseudobutyrivibrio sp. AR14]SFR64647.1 Ribosomal protein L7Ae [Pseudobutyrivibrio sp. NOR37]
MIDKALNMISLAMKAGALASGEFACEEAIKGGTGFLCIVATDASANTKKSFSNSCEFYGVDYVEYGTKESLGHAIGKEYRASIVVCDENLSLSILNKIRS